MTRAVAPTEWTRVGDAGQVGERPPTTPTTHSTHPIPENRATRFAITARGMPTDHVHERTPRPRTAYEGSAIFSPVRGGMAPSAESSLSAYGSKVGR